ncbi:MAG: DUF86 domain-containing protein [Acidobacteria bacterium]|nr:DUF86 domain-containing protein [Acidobacteriota bacterium]
MVDRDLVLRKLADLDTYLGQLAPYREIDLDRYRRDWTTQRIVERTLHLAIEACMDVADHVVADRRLRVPETGGAAFEILGEADILPDELGRSLARMVGFRNILVHDYARLDPEIVLRVVRTDVQDLERFRQAVLSII